jgi:hypothetical protein
MKDSLSRIDLFRCESAALRTYWVLVVMDEHNRHIIRFGIHAETIKALRYAECSTKRCDLLDPFFSKSGLGDLDISTVTIQKRKAH